MPALSPLIRRMSIVAALLVAFGVWVSAQAKPTPERYTALAVNLGDTPVNWTSLNVEMSITRWSTDAEHDRLLNVLLDKGAEALLEELRDMPRAGHIRTPDSLGYDLRFARKTRGEDGGLRILLATDRPIGFAEAANRARTIDYPFTVIELRLNDEGEGEGTMSLLAKIIPDKRNKILVLEDFGTQPIRLQAVRRVR